MNKSILAILALLSCFLPLSTVAGDSRIPGDDLVETSFHGIVTDSETGEPIQEAYVYAWTSDFNNYAIDFTDEKGEYYLEFNLGGDFFIYATKEDYSEFQETVSVNVNDETEMNIKLDPIHYSSKIFGTVTDADTGAPIDQVNINLYQTTSDGSWAYLKSVNTEQNGKYSFDVNDGTYGLEFNKGGYDYYSQEKIVVSGEDVQIDVQLQGAEQSVSGVVTDENGDPMEGVVVTLEGNQIRYYNVTDMEGNYEIMVIQPGDYTLSASANGHRPFYQKVTLDEGEMQKIDIQMHKAYLPDPILRIVYGILLLIGLVG